MISMSQGKKPLPKIKRVGGAEVIRTSKQAPREGAESGVAAVEALCRPTRAKLYGYDWEKKRVDNKLDKRRPIRISQAVSILLNASEHETIPICKAFLKKFDYADDDIRGPISRRMFFSGSDANNDIKPKEMRYAVFRLLGLSEPVALNILGEHDKNAGQRFELSESFLNVINRVQAERSLYPLEHIDEFPGLTNALNGITTPPHNIKVKDVFKTNRVPPVSSWQKNGSQSELPLDAVLSILRLALEGRTSSEIAARVHGLSTIKVSENEVGILLSTPELSPFSDTVLKLVDEKRKEKKGQQVQPEKDLG